MMWMIEACEKMKIYKVIEFMKLIIENNLRCEKHIFPGTVTNSGKK